MEEFVLQKKAQEAGVTSSDYVQSVTLNHDLVSRSRKMRCYATKEDTVSQYVLLFKKSEDKKGQCLL
ncbi:MAG: hypothetical protein ACK5MI_01785 [Mangrovibacterium sp.]